MFNLRGYHTLQGDNSLKTRHLVCVVHRFPLNIVIHTVELVYNNYLWSQDFCQKYHIIDYFGENNVFPSPVTSAAISHQILIVKLHYQEPR
jgi:hypothetical protein